MTPLPWVTCAKVYVRNNNGFYSFIARQYGELLTAWQGGRTFFKGETLDGDEITIKLAEVEAVMFCSPASQQRAVDRAQAEQKASERETFE